MARWFPALLLALLACGQAPAAGLLIPSDSGTSPLAMLDHKVSVAIEEQVAVTRVEQTFRNHTDRQLEATYIFPVPKGASVNRFSMWVDGKEVKGEFVEAEKARAVYTEIVTRLKDPGLLEHMGNNLLRLRIFPVPARGDQKVALSFTAVAERDNGLVRYSYPLKTDGTAAQTLEKFSLSVKIKSAHAVQNVYSPTHAVTVKHKGDRIATATFEAGQQTLDKDFELFYALGDKDVGLTTLLHRPERDQPGHFLLLIAPRAQLAQTQEVPRDFVFVLDTSGSMQGPKIVQAQKALRFCLERLSQHDRFAVLNFASTVGQFREGLTPVNESNVAKAKKWVDELEAVGGTAIDDALKAALDLRSRDTGRSFTVVFFTDGEPTVGETNPEKIFKAVNDRNSTNTRIFTFGVGDDVNATLLDRLAEGTRAVSTYVRPQEDIETKVSGLYGKISHPVLTDLKLTAGRGVKLTEMYPNKLPDLFHGGQLVVLGRYTGKGHAAVKLTGKVGDEEREFVHEVNFAGHTNEDRSFVEHLWARRKVGYLLDEVRRNGEKKELVDEVVKLARKHGITTPYTSYLVVPDSVTRTPVVNAVPDVDTRFQVRNGAMTGGRIQAGTIPVDVGRTNYAPVVVQPGTAGGPVTVGEYGAGYAPQDPPEAPLLLGSATPQDGGLYPYSEYVMYRQTAPLKSQQVAVRGLTIIDSSTPGASNGVKAPETTAPMSAPVATSGTTNAPGAPWTNHGYQIQVQPSGLGLAVPNDPQSGAQDGVNFKRLRRQPIASSAGPVASRASNGKEEEEEEEEEQSAGVGSAGGPITANQTQLRTALAQGQAHTGKLAVDLAQQLDALRNQNQLGATASRTAAGRTCRQIGSVWVDEGFDVKMPTLKVKAMSKAYFRLLAKRPELTAVFKLGTRVVWVAPNGTALVIDPSGGKEDIADAEIETLFVRK